MGVRTTRNYFSAALALIVSAWVCSASFATDLVAGAGDVVPGVTTSPTGANHLGGTGAVPFASLPFSKFTGTLTTDVYNNDSANPYGATALTFTYLIHSNPNALHVAIERFVAIDFSGFRVDDQGYSIALGGTNPTGMSLIPSADGVSFNFGISGIADNSNSALLVIHTNATAFTSTIDQMIDSETAFVPSLGPTVVPEPATLGLIGLTSLALVRRRRH